MHFVLLIHRSPEAYQQRSEAEYQAVVARYQAFAEEQTAQGRFVSSVRLYEPRKSIVVRKPGGEGKAVVTDGPFAETKELLAGLFVLQCDSAAEVVEVARSLPAALDGGAVEVRPVFDLPGALAVEG